MKTIKQFILEELNIIQCLKAVAQWVQIAMLVLIYLGVREIINLLK
jgi:hypothetical protein